MWVCWTGESLPLAISRVCVNAAACGCAHGVRHDMVHGTTPLSPGCASACCTRCPPPLQSTRSLHSWCRRCWVMWPETCVMQQQEQHGCSTATPVEPWLLSPVILFQWSVNTRHVSHALHSQITSPAAAPAPAPPLSYPTLSYPTVLPRCTALHRPAPTRHCPALHRTHPPLPCTPLHPPSTEPTRHYTHPPLHCTHPS